MLTMFGSLQESTSTYHLGHSGAAPTSPPRPELQVAPQLPPASSSQNQRHIQGPRWRRPGSSVTLDSLGAPAGGSPCSLLGRATTRTAPCDTLGEYPSHFN